VDPDPGSGIFLALDPGCGMAKFAYGFRYKHPGSLKLRFIKPDLEHPVKKCRILYNDVFNVWIW
jgi:hypothetical protein